MQDNPTVVFPKKQVVELQDRSRPEPGEGEVLIRSHRTLISTGTELTMLNGNFPDGSYWDNYISYPCLPGYCNIGTVIALGRGVDSEWLGRRVGTYGGHSRYVTALASDCRIVPAGISDEDATFFTLGEIVMQGVRRSKICWGESAVIYGLGLLGQLALRICRIAGALPVIGVDVSTYRLALLPQQSSIVGLNATTDKVEEAVTEITRGRKADVVFEVTGNPTLIPGEFSSLRKQGRFVVLSSPTGKTTIDLHDLCGAPSFTIIGSHNFSHPTHATLDNPWTFLRDAELFFDWVATGDLQIAPLISHRASYRDAGKLYQQLVDDRTTAMGVVLDWDPENSGA